MSAIKFQLELPARRIADLLTNAIEGSFAPWCNGVFIKGVAAKRAAEHLRRAKRPYHWYADSRLFEGEFTLEVHEIKDEDKEAEGSNIRVHRIHRRDVAAGLAIMAKEAPHELANILDENEDGPTADSFLQCIALKDVVYN